MNTIGRLMKLFIGAVAMVAAFAVAPAATAAPGDGGDGGSPGATATQTQTVAQSLPSIPGLGDLPDVRDLSGVSELQSSIEDALPGSLPRPGGQAPAPSPAPQPQPQPQSRSAPSTPCSAQARACVSLGSQQAWLQDGAGNVVRGPVQVSTGKPGFETPPGTTRVTRKVVDEWSRPYNAPMPYAVYFSAGSTYPHDIGIAFHEGAPTVLSHGCVRLWHDDAAAFFNHLQVGDMVQVV
ncbi:L,D-transpeptidase [Candidatus Corynebacterium faecigallinarum]|uniref:L,D-transpeptidase n=1 Tax=Candidatus Corynebacterium faecigallinarum TaxID=2838528 RepID=UPI003FD43A78